AEKDSYSQGLLEYPQYTRPAVYRDFAVPDVLLSGNHAQVAKWRRQEALRRTWLRRPELLQHVELSDQDQAFLEKLKESSPSARE
ncbi:MAG: tRNA (guanosine(37)-N1)-methyltransferase TrmD, partial [Chloroflexi bacterium]|nr:tRNA (guanosine(37)-N1)-methyltransferase TrmD [Chloroflexota bacterium]